MRASASRFEPRKSCSSEASRLALAAAASAMRGSRLGGRGAASVRAGGGCAAATGGVVSAGSAWGGEGDELLRLPQPEPCLFGKPRRARNPHRGDEHEG